MSTSDRSDIPRSAEQPLNLQSIALAVTSGRYMDPTLKAANVRLVCCDLTGRDLADIGYEKTTDV